MTKPNKWALLVGIDDYPNIGKLNGAKNDARLMAELWTAALHSAENTVLLLDAGATRDRLLAALEHLSERAEDDDALVFFYSGHGWYLPDPAGGWPNSKVSTLVPYDMGT